MLRSLVFLLLLYHQASVVVSVPPVVGFLVSRNATLTKIGSGPNYNVRPGTTFRLQRVRYRADGDDASAQIQLRGILASKERVTLTATFLDRFVAVAEDTLFALYPIGGGNPRLFRVEGTGVLYYNKWMCTFTVVRAAKFKLREVSTLTELTVVLTYYFNANIGKASSPFAPGSIQPHLQREKNYFDTVTVYAYAVGNNFVAPYVYGQRLIGISVAIHGSDTGTESPSTIQSELQCYFDDLNDGYTYIVLPPPTLDDSSQTDVVQCD